MSALLTTRLDAMSLDELRRERDYWHRIENDETWSSAGRAVARDFRIGCDAVIARRFPEGSEPQPDQQQPDTADLPEPNGVIIGPVSLRPHRVPVLDDNGRDQ